MQNNINTKTAISTLSNQMCYYTKNKKNKKL